MNNKNKKLNLNKNFIVFLKILVGVIVIVILLYFVTIFISNHKTLGDEYTGTDTTEAVITYDTAVVGTVFNRPDKEYYVWFDNFTKGENSYISSLVDNYSSGDDALPVYEVDMGLGRNSKYLSKSSNSNAQSVNELKIQIPTLMKIKNGKNIKYLEKTSDIKNELS